MEPNNPNQPNNLSNFEYVLAPANNQRPTKRSKIRENLGTILILLAAPILAGLLSLFVFRTYQVDGPSMLTTLHHKDRLVINKFPVTVSKISGKDYIPNRYDIIVFEHKGSFGGLSNTNKQIIKRVIALPGERIVIKNGFVTVYNKENPNGFAVDEKGPEANVIGVTEGIVDETIKDGEIFVMGDNRVDSFDSRGMGPINSDDIVGKLEFRIYPFKDWQSF